MQQMHQGQIPGPPNLPEQTYNNQQDAPQQFGQNGAIASPPVPISLSQPPNAASANATSLDDLLSGAAKDADKAANAAETKPEAPKPAVVQEEKKAKKEKDKNMKLIYSDNEVSPEEKMAKLPRYAFVPSG